MRSNLPSWVPPAAGVLAAALVVVLSYLGSRGFRDFDSALVGYAVALVFTVGALVYRYTTWISRPPTWRYFRAGWSSFLSWRNFRRYATLVPRTLWRDIFAQTFILRRGWRRWLMHMSLFWGVVLSLAVTVPLTLGWVRFTLARPGVYQAWVFGVPLNRFALETPMSFTIFHLLDIGAVLVLLGIGIALWRRTSDGGLLVLQRFGFDLLPLALLFGICVTGIALTLSSHYWNGRFYWFISLTHELVVVAWLLSIPFGKFFHIVERPATVGVTLYQTVSETAQPASCRRCAVALPSQPFVADLQATLADLGQRYPLGEGRGVLQDYCPTCKRLLRGEAYYRMLGKRFL